MRNKSGLLAEQVIFFIPRIIFLIAVIFSVVIIVKKFIITSIDVREVEANILISRLIFSKVISYNDPSLNRLYPGIVDLDKFRKLSSDSGLLDKSIDYGDANPIIAARLTLKLAGGNEIDGKKYLAAYYNKKKFDEWFPKIQETVTGGSGSVKMVNDNRLVLIKEKDEFTPGMIEFEVLG